jgi:hypothetical protein
MTITYLQRAALAGAFVVPIAALTAVLAQSDGDEPAPGEESPCDGCGVSYPPGELTEGPLDTRWCAACNAAADAAPPAPVFDCVDEDDGEP